MCGCNGESATDAAPVYFGRQNPWERRYFDTCDDCQNARWVPVLAPAGDAASDARAAAEQARLAREQADRTAVLGGVSTAAGTFSSTFTAAQETERARIAADAARATASSAAAAQQEIARINAERDVRIAQAGGVAPGSTPTYSLAPIEQRTDSASAFPVVPVLIGAGVLGVLGIAAVVALK